MCTIKSHEIVIHNINFIWSVAVDTVIQSSWTNWFDEFEPDNLHTLDEIDKHHNRKIIELDQEYVRPCHKPFLIRVHLITAFQWFCCCFCCHCWYIRFCLLFCVRPARIYIYIRIESESINHDIRIETKSCADQLTSCMRNERYHNHWSLIH